VEKRKIKAAPAQQKQGKACQRSETWFDCGVENDRRTACNKKQELMAFDCEVDSNSDKNLFML
jgi:hypothetical protein